MTPSIDEFRPETFVAIGPSPATACGAHHHLIDYDPPATSHEQRAR